MPTVRILTAPLPDAEPVSLALLKAHVREDADSQDELLSLYGRAARQKVEAYTGRYFAPQTLALTYELGEAYELPSGATALSVSGYFDTLEALTSRLAYLEEYRKGISIERQLPWGVALSQTYTVTVAVLADPAYLDLAKRAMLELAAEWYKNRESSTNTQGLSELPVSWRVTLAEARLTPLGIL